MVGSEAEFSNSNLRDSVIIKTRAKVLTLKNLLPIVTKGEDSSSEPSTNGLPLFSWYQKYDF